MLSGARPHGIGFVQNQPRCFFSPSALPLPCNSNQSWLLRTIWTLFSSLNTDLFVGWLGIPGSISGVVFSIAVFVLAQRGAPLVAAAVPWLGSRLPGTWNLRRNSRSLPTGTDADDAPAKGTRWEEKFSFLLTPQSHTEICTYCVTLPLTPGLKVLMPPSRAQMQTSPQANRSFVRHPWQILRCRGPHRHVSS